MPKILGPKIQARKFQARKFRPKNLDPKFQARKFRPEKLGPKFQTRKFKPDICAYEYITIPRTSHGPQVYTSGFGGFVVKTQRVPVQGFGLQPHLERDLVDSFFLQALQLRALCEAVAEYGDGNSASEGRGGGGESFCLKIHT